MHSRKCNFTKEGKKCLPNADTANEIVTKKMNELKKRSEMKDDTELQIVCVLQCNMPASGKMFKLADGICYPSNNESGFGSIDMIKEDFFVKSVIVNHFKWKNDIKGLQSLYEVVYIWKKCSSLGVISNYPS